MCRRDRRERRPDQRCAARPRRCQGPRAIPDRGTSDLTGGGVVDRVIARDPRERAAQPVCSNGASLRQVSVQG